MKTVPDKEPIKATEVASIISNLLALRAFNVLNVDLITCRLYPKNTS